MEIEFSFGKLLSKDKRVKFEFNTSKLAQMLPESIESGFFQYDATQLPYNLDDEEGPGAATDFMDALEDVDYYTSAPISTRSTKPSSVLPPLSSRSTRSAMSVNPSANAPSLFESTTTSSFQDTNKPESSDEMNFDQPEEEEEEAPLPPELRGLLDRLEKKEGSLSKEEFRKRAVDSVLEQAFMRSLNGIEVQAKTDDDIDLIAIQEQANWKQTLLDKRVVESMNGSELQTALGVQQRINEQRRRDERQEQLESQVHVFLQDRPKEMVEETKRQLDKDLTYQINDKAVRTKSLQQVNLSKERDYLKQLSMELELHKVMERASHLEKQRSLLQAWERDGHVRNLRKVQTYGQGAVKDYIDKNLGEVADPTVMPKSLGMSLNMSIGYDPRKGKGK